jgi:hypothetical protein
MLQRSVIKVNAEAPARDRAAKNLTQNRQEPATERRDLSRVHRCN